MRFDMLQKGCWSIGLPDNRSVVLNHQYDICSGKCAVERPLLGFLANQTVVGSYVLRGHLAPHAFNACRAAGIISMLVWWARARPAADRGCGV